ncbi:MAG: sigma 54-interacting transcriptional regulator [Planctomycetes bacterium]|nr:sigma 54-interacting transcriptional regulator [Planctomycetota bacterium]
MKKRLSEYLKIMDSAMERRDVKKVKSCGEAALRELTGLSFTPLEEFTLYYWLGHAYYSLREYSKALDVSYKASMLALKHSMKPAYSAYTFVMMGSNFMLLRNINPAIEQFRKAEQYLQKYGTDTHPMSKDAYYTVTIGLAYCYLYRNQLEKVREIIETKLTNYEDGVAVNRLFPINYHHLKGEYEIALKDNINARRTFNECVRFSRELNLPPAGLEAKLHIAFIDMLENKNESAEDILKSVIKDAKDIHLHEIIGEASLLLSKCYTLMNMPEKAVAVEHGIKPLLSRIDMGWLYERSREYEHLYNRLHSEGIQDGRVIPEVLIDTINGRHERSGYQDAIIGNSLVMRDIYNLIEKIASTDLPILIQGETGTGKELIARALHRNSLRKENTLLSLNCGALPETLLESELFGYVKGAFTGAVEDKKGYMEIASEGTLFLDEIADMSMKMQQRLLRALEEKQMWKIGGTKPTLINTRFVFASNQDVEQLIAKKLFREDLFYRISTIIVNLPPLRDRKEDVPLLVQHFIGRYSSGGKLIKVPDAVMEILTNYLWPGNIRELENEIKRICILHKDAPALEESMLSEAILSCRLQAVRSADGVKGLRELRADFERDVILRTIKECNGNISRAARMLKYNRSELYNKMKALGINGVAGSE